MYHDKEHVDEGINEGLIPVWYKSHHTHHDRFIVENVVGSKAVLIAEDVEDHGANDAYGDD